MADRIIISKLHPSYDGEYEFDTDEFTHGELHTIMRLSGVRLGEFNEELAKVNASLVMALGVVCLTRENKPIDESVFWNGKAGSIQLVGDEEEAETGPPAQEPPAPANRSGSKASPTGKSTGNGSVSLETAPSPSGERTLALPATSGSQTSPS